MRQARVVPASVMPAPPLLSAWSEVASSDTCVAEVPLLSIRHSVHLTRVVMRAAPLLSIEASSQRSSPLQTRRLVPEARSSMARPVAVLFSLISEPPVAEMRSRVPVIASTAMCAVPLVSIAASAPAGCPFSSITEPPVAEMRSRVPVIASTAMCAVPLVSIAASLVCSGCSAVILAAPPAFNPVIPASGVSSENAAMPLASSRVMPAAGT